MGVKVGNGIRQCSRKLNAFEMWCYRRMLKISWKDRITNVEVLQRMHTSLHFMSNMKKRKLEYAGHVMRGSSGETHLYMYILEGKMYGKKSRGRPRRIWMDDITEWTGLKHMVRQKG